MPVRAHTATPMTASRAEVTSKYGLDEIGDESVAGWDDMDLEDGNGGKGKLPKKDKKKALGAVAIVED